MQLKPIAQRTNVPIIAAFIVWLVAIAAMGFSHAAYMVLTGVAVALFLCQIGFNVRAKVS